jgi:hypothetical protein
LKRTLWRLAAASLGAATALSLNVGAASALNTPGHAPVRFPHGPVQVADQAARTDQDAHSFAKSEQILPINANVPVQILSLGHNGGDTTQSNRSSAESAAVNKAWTDQSIDQHQRSYPKAHDEAPKYDGHESHPEKDHCPKGADGEDHDWKDRGPKGDSWEKGPKGPEGAFQGASQWAGTRQDAHSKAESTQFVPINVNAPIQVLSLGENGGDTKQSNRSSAESAAVNESGTEQSVDQSQQAGNGSWGHGGGPFQGASQAASTDQDAHAAATSKQIAPVNVNAPIQVLSLGSNGGDTWQSNRSSAESAAANEAWTAQSADQQQAAGGQGGGAFQGASQGASTDQDAGSHAKSEQVLPVNLNVPVQALSLGHNGGDTAQSNSSSAQSNAFNQAGTSQGAGQAQGGLPGLTG